MSSPTTAFQADAFQFDAFQIFDETTTDDGITKTIVSSKYITASLAKLPHDTPVTTTQSLPVHITA